MKRILLLVAVGVGFLAGCTSTERVSDVLVPLEPSAEADPSPTPSPTPGANYQALAQTLKDLGYEGVGLEFESDAVHGLLLKVFSDPRSKDRRIRTIYTGAKTAYDAKAESLTVGNAQSESEVLSFVEKQVPKRLTR